jgi:hypothetical protein
MFALPNAELHGIMSQKTGLLIVLAVSCAEVALGDRRFQSDNNTNRYGWWFKALGTGFSGQGM